MNFESVVMVAAGLLASLIASMLSARYGQNHLNRLFLSRIRISAKSLLNGKELDSFFSDYLDLLSALVKLAAMQCFSLLILAAPMVSVYAIAAQYCTSTSPKLVASEKAWTPPHDLGFMLAFMLGTFWMFIRRRL